MKFYRYTMMSMDDGDWDIASSTGLKLTIYYSIKTTPCGYWIEIPYKKNKWISNTSVRKFAYPTEK